jgi:hypothetical protein
MANSSHGQAGPNSVVIAAQAIWRALREVSPVVDVHLRNLLAEAGLPADASRGSDARRRVIEAVAALLDDLLAAERSDVLTDIRRFYTDAQDTYTVEELASMWRVPLPDVVQIFADSYSARAPHDPEGSFSITRAEALSAGGVFHVFRAVDIERALCPEDDECRSQAWTTVPLMIHLPRFAVEAIQRTPFIPSPRTLAAAIERVLTEWVEADAMLNAIAPR